MEEAPREAQLQGPLPNLGELHPLEGLDQVHDDRDRGLLAVDLAGLNAQQGLPNCIFC